MGEKEGREIIERLLKSDKNLGSAASFISGVGEAVADEYSHEVLATEKLPSRDELNAYYQKAHGSTIKDMVHDILKVFEADENEEIVKFLEDIFFEFFEESWKSYQEDPNQYSGFLDSEGVYTEKELSKFDRKGGEIPLSKPSPLDTSERRTKIVIRVSTRERMRNWDNTRNEGRERSYDEIINDLLDIIPKSTDLSRANLPLRERQILKVLQGGNKTSEEVKLELELEKEGTELSLRAVQTNLSSLMRRGLVSRKRKGNTTEYFLVNIE